MTAIYCPNCQGMAEATLDRCPHCGYDKLQEVWTCSSCQHQIPYDTATCPNCGAAKFKCLKCGAHYNGATLETDVCPNCGSELGMKSADTAAKMLVGCGVVIAIVVGLWIFSVCFGGIF